ncbi:MAG: LrgB family protein [Oscillospiraceae bacterium]|nr:LrgB family protein [Oscillospiraceae bacterium]
MAEFFQNSVFFGSLVSLAFYGVGVLLKQKLKLAIFNPLLVAILLTMAFLLVFDIDYETYHAGAKYLSFLLTPATVALAIPLYEQFQKLKENAAAVAVGIITGVVTSMVSVLILCRLFGLGHVEYVTLLPKSITTAIGMGVSEELGGYVAITVAVIIVTGIIGNIIAQGVCRIFRITHPVAKGIGIGSASHAIGTTKAMELGEVEGAMSGLSIALSGILTVLLAGVFAKFM